MRLENSRCDTFVDPEYAEKKVPKSYLPAPVP
jgi:hypothetical protein